MKIAQKHWELLQHLKHVSDWAEDLEHLGPFHKDPALSHAYIMARILGARSKEAPQFARQIVEFYKKIYKIYSPQLKEKALNNKI